MPYHVEPFHSDGSSSQQLGDIHQFLSRCGEMPANEHFHWGRFDWMLSHSMLESQYLPLITLFRDESNTIIGMITFDTCYDDRFYLLHTSDDEALLCQMLDTASALENADTLLLKVSDRDTAMIHLLASRGFCMEQPDVSVLALDLLQPLEVRLPSCYRISPKGFSRDPWQYQLVIHRGFDHEGLPKPISEKEHPQSSRANPDLQVFAIHDDSYCAHCGLWYEHGDTAYVEPVVTIPEHRKQGLARAVIYTACLRARDMGARRAVVLSDNPFYRRIGFTSSSAVYRWKKKNEPKRSV